MSDTPAAAEQVSLSPQKKRLFALIVALFFTLVLYALSVLQRSHKLYKHLQDDIPSWEGRLMSADAALGFKPIAKSHGYEILSQYDKVAVHFDEHGCRSQAPDKRPSTPDEASVLALGCSYTFAAHCELEDSYVYRVASVLRARPYNAGVCGYGLAHVLIRARRLIPKLKPKIVLVQYSPWLTHRSLINFAPTQRTLIPTPYFTKTDNGLQLAAPLYQAPVFKFDLSPRLNQKRTQLSFHCFTGCPLILQEDITKLYGSLKIVTGLAPEICNSHALVNKAAYSEILELCKSVKARMVVVILGNGKAFESPQEIKDLGVLVVNTPDTLHAYLSQQQSKNYSQHFHIQGGKPRRVLDPHPNAKAHALIAEAILKGLKSS